MTNIVIKPREVKSFHDNDNASSRNIHFSLIQSSMEWVSTWKPPVWLIRGLLQRRYLYVLTAPAGTGKTAVALTLAAYVALGRDIGDYRVNPGRVLYLAGENPDDIKTRWLLMAEVMGLDPTAIPVDFVFGTPPYAKIVQEAEAAGREYALVIVDTDQAFFDKPDGDGMNGNDNRKQWAQELRLGTNMPGGPTMLVLAHPPKETKQPPFRPYGGNAFLNEIDANMYLQRQDGFILLNRDPEKFRGPEFPAVPFELKSVASAERQDGDGNPVFSVRAVPLKADEYDAQKAKTQARLNAAATDIMALLFSEPGQSLQWYADQMGKTKRQAQGLIAKLTAQGLVGKDENGKPYLTVRGEEAFRTSNQNDGNRV